MNDPQQNPIKMVDHIFSANVAVYREDNHAVLQTFFKGLASGLYQDGTRHQLHLDLSDHKIIYRNTSNDDACNALDANLILVTENKHHARLLNQQAIAKIKDADIYSWGFNGWLVGLEGKITGILNN